MDTGRGMFLSLLSLLLLMAGSTEAARGPTQVARIQVRRRAQGANTTVTRYLGGRIKYLSEEQKAGLVENEKAMKALMDAFLNVTKVKNGINATTGGTLTPAELDAAVQTAFASQLADLLQQLANVDPNGDLTPSQAANQLKLDALKRALELSQTTLGPNTTGVFEPYQASWDSRNVGLVSPVRDQGQCGTCVPFCTTAAMEGSLAKANNVSLNNETQTSQQQLWQQLSPQWMYFCASPTDYLTCDSGMDLDYVSTFIPNTGMQYEACYPYNPGEGSNVCKTPACTGDLGPTGKWQQQDFMSTPASSFGNNIVLAKQHIRNYGAVTSTFLVPSDFGSYSGGVIQQTKPWDMSQSHAVAVVGYNDLDPIPHWIAKNSWGGDWGEGGFFRIAYEGTALMTLDAVGFIYNPANSTAPPAAPGSSTPASMVCYGTFWSGMFNGLNFTGESFDIQSNPLAQSTPATNLTYPNLNSTATGDWSTPSWANRISSYNLTCRCQGTGSCINLAQGMTWTYYQGVNLTGNSGSVVFDITNCAADVCAVMNNTAKAFDQKIMSMAFSWAPRTSGIVGNQPPAPPGWAPGAANQLLVNWIMTTCAGVLVFAVLAFV